MSDDTTDTNTEDDLDDLFEEISPEEDVADFHDEDVYTTEHEPTTIVKGDEEDGGADDEEPASRSQQVGETVGTAAGVVAAVPVYLLSGLSKGVVKGTTAGVSSATKWIPRGHNLWKNIAVNSLRKYKKTSGADAVNLVARANNHIEPQAVAWNPSTEDDPESYWQNKSGEEKWHPATLGEGVDLLGGKVPVILSHEDNIHSFKPVEATISEVVDMDKVEDLVHYDQLTHVTVEQQVTPGDGGQAVADGGVQQRTTEEYMLPEEQRAQLDDVLINPFSPDGNAGYRISWSKTDELLSETTTTEEMQRQEDRGRIAEMDQSGKKDFVLKVLLYCALIIAAVEMGPPLIEAIFGGGGGGGGDGGGVIPLMLGGMF